jgi:threonyl-tRNA synthetase
MANTCREFYGLLGLKFRINLSTRPEKYMGELETWNRAEARLTEALDEFSQCEGGVPWKLKPEDGAFYGPKIDIDVLDCLGRDWQCATVQLDFQQPQNFSLEYQTADQQQPSKTEAPAPAAPSKSAPPTEDDDQSQGEKKTHKTKFLRKPLSPGCARPVMIHRAICGSLERFTAILCEHFAGKWPFWLSPRQVLVIPVGMGFVDYACEVQKVLKDARLYADVDTSGNTLQKKIRSGQLAAYNFILVVGNDEMKNRKVNVRWRDDTATQVRDVPVGLDEAVTKLVQLKTERGSGNPFQLAS